MTLSSRRVFIATLGSEPQVVSVGACLLQQAGMPHARVVVIHTSPRLRMIADALRRLQEAFAEPPLDGLKLELVEIQRDGRPMTDILEEEEARATFQTIYGVLKAEKAAGREVHFSIAGGRKVMSTYGMAAAQLLFDAGDALYHLFSDDAFLKERRMLPQAGDRVRLVPVPVLRLGADAMMFQEILTYDNPLDAMRRGHELTRQREYQRAETFARYVLTEAEERVAQISVTQGLQNAEIAQALNLSRKTVANHLSSIYAKLEEYLGYPDTPAGRQQLMLFLLGYYQGGGARKERK